MGTRSFIGIEMPSGSILAIYCHWDGYPEGVGKTLLENYTDREKIMELLRLGDISSLSSTPEYTEAYHRDKGEELHPARILTIDDMINCWAEYCYKFTLDGHWEVKGLGSSQPWYTVEAAIEDPNSLWDKED